MSSKRELKKMINRIGNELSYKAMMVGALTDEDINTIDSLVAKAVTMQLTALSHLNVSFDKAPRDFESGREYRKARRTYYAKACAALRKELNDKLSAFVKDLNAAVPVEYREALKEAANA